MLGGKIDVRDVPTLEFEARRPSGANRIANVVNLASRSRRLLYRNLIASLPSLKSVCSKPEVLIVDLLLHHFLHRLIHREAAGLLPWWKLLKRFQVLAHDRLSRNKDERVLNEPFVVSARLVFGSLEGIGTKVENLGRTQRNQRLHPDLQAVSGLFHEDDLVLIETKASEIAVVGPIKELAALVGTVG